MHVLGANRGTFKLDGGHETLSRKQNGEVNMPLLSLLAPGLHWGLMSTGILQLSAGPTGSLILCLARAANPAPDA